MNKLYGLLSMMLSILHFPEAQALPEKRRNRRSGNGLQQTQRRQRAAIDLFEDAVEVL